MRLLFILLLITVTAGAEGSAQLFIERGLLMQHHFHDPAHAAALYRRALTAEDATPRTSAEALWHMSAGYANRGSDRTSLLILTKLQHDFPGVEPFAKLAAAESIGLSSGAAEIANPRTAPNLVDLLAAQDTVHLLAAAEKLKADDAAAGLRERFRWHCEAMNFELSIAETTETAEERRDREAALAQCRDWLKDPAAAKPNAHTVLQDDPLLTRIFAARDAFTDALGASDTIAAQKALTGLRTLIAPLTGGPKELLIVLAHTGELAGAARAAALLEKGEPAGALLAWAETRRVFQDSGAANAGFQLNDPDSIPAELLPEIMGALTFLEWAIAGIINDEIEASQRELETCIARLTAIAGKCQAPDGKLRLEQTVRRLREAAGKLAQNDTDSADRLMRTELYISP